jgi:hypothetical protein
VRARVTPVRAVERLAGMQAQLARPPYIGLWSRLAGFRREQLTRALLRRDIVRVTSMRGTLHLMSARDYLAMRGALQPALTNSTMRDRAKGIDVARVTDAARVAAVADDVLTPDEIEQIKQRVTELLGLIHLGYAKGPDKLAPERAAVDEIRSYLT